MTNSNCIFSHIFSDCCSLSLSLSYTHTLCLSVSLSIRMRWTWKSHPHQELSHLITLPGSGQTWKPWSFAFVQLLKNNEKYIPPPIWLLCEKRASFDNGQLGSHPYSSCFTNNLYWWSLSHSFELGWLWNTGTCAFSTCTNKRLIKWGVYSTTYGIVLFILFSLKLIPPKDSRSKRKKGLQCGGAEFPCK